MQNKPSEKPQKMRFTTLRDHFNTAGMAGAAYVPYLYDMQSRIKADDVLTNLALIGGIFLSLRVKYVREIPMLLSRLLLPLIVRGKAPAPPRIEKIVSELAQSAGMKKPPTPYLYNKGITKNAMAFGGDIFVGKKLADQLDDNELKFILAHELSHIKAHDMSDRYLLWPPFITAFMACYQAAADTLVNAFTQGKGGTSAALFVAANLGYLLYQGGIFKFHSRYVERRADKNALLLTGDIVPAITGLEKIGVDINETPSPRERFFSTHPRDKDRIDHLVKIFNENDFKDHKTTLSNDKNDQKSTQRPPFSQSP